MATITIRASGVCAGGGHVQISVTGDKTAQVSVTVDEVLDSITPQEIEATVKVLMRLATSGMTKAQARAKLQAGFNVVTS